MMTIKLKVMRPLHWRGMAHAAGEILSADTLTASALVASGRAKLVDHADLALLLDAEQEHTAAACRDTQTFRPRGWATR